MLEEFAVYTLLFIVGCFLFESYIYMLLLVRWLLIGTWSYFIAVEKQVNFSSTQGLTTITLPTVLFVFGIVIFVCDILLSIYSVYLTVNNRKQAHSASKIEEKEKEKEKEKDRINSDSNDKKPV